MVLGYSPESFWQQTPRTLQLAFDAAAIRNDTSHNDDARIAWYIAALSRTKKLPHISKLMIKKTNGAALPMEKQLQNLQRWVAATGGKVIVKPRNE